MLEYSKDAWQLTHVKQQWEDPHLQPANMQNLCEYCLNINASYACCNIIKHKKKD